MIYTYIKIDIFRYHQRIAWGCRICKGLVLLNGDIGAQSGDRSEPTPGDTKVVAKVMTS